MHEILAKLEPLTEAAALTIHGIEGVMDRIEGLEVRSGMILFPCLSDFPDLAIQVAWTAPSDVSIHQDILEIERSLIS